MYSVTPEVHRAVASTNSEHVRGHGFTQLTSFSFCTTRLLVVFIYTSTVVVVVLELLLQLYAVQYAIATATVSSFTNADGVHVPREPSAKTTRCVIKCSRRTFAKTQNLTSKRRNTADKAPHKRKKRFPATLHSRE